VLAWLKARFAKVDDWLEGRPLVVVDHGRMLEDSMLKARVAKDDVMAAARERQGIERLDQIKYAVLERSGGISIIPFERN